MKRFLYFNMLLYLMLNIVIVKAASNFLKGFSTGINRNKMNSQVNISSAYTLMASQQLTNEEIIETVARYFNLTTDALKYQVRFRRIAFPRQVAMWFCVNNNLKNNPKLPDWTGVAALFNKKTHATAMHAFKTIENLIETNQNVRETINQLSEKIDLQTKTIKDYEKIND